MHISLPILRVASAGLLSLAGLFTAPLYAQSRQRPLSDFISAQGTTQCFTPPAPAQIGWTGCLDATCKELAYTRFAMIDYTGRMASDLGLNVGTKVTGTVMERALGDGRALVTVNLHATNAIGWALDFSNMGPGDDFNSAPLSFGYRPQDLSNSLLKPAFGNSHFRATFTNSRLGDPLPDLVCINSAYCPQVTPCPDLELDELSIQASITGPLRAASGLGPEGAPAKLDVTQVGPVDGALKKPRTSGPLNGGWSAEKVTIHPLGK